MEFHHSDSLGYQFIDHTEVWNIFTTPRSQLLLFWVVLLLIHLGSSVAHYIALARSPVFLFSSHRIRIKVSLGRELSCVSPQCSVHSGAKTSLGCALGWFFTHSPERILKRSYYTVVWSSIQGAKRFIFANHACVHSNLRGVFTYCI